MKTTTKELLPVVEATWASFEGFRKLGFLSDDIYVVADNAGPDVFVQVRQGERQFNFRVGPRGDLSTEQFFESWKRYAARVNSRDVPDQELERIYDVWLNNLDAVGLMLAMERKGLSIPIRL